MLINMRKVFEDVIGRHLNEKVEVIKIDLKTSNSWLVGTRDHGTFTITKETDGGFSVF